MASSGTRSVQSVRAQSLLDYAIRACGKSSNVQTAETQEAGKDALTLILQNLPNRGVDLWNIQEYIFGPLAYQKQFTLPIGTVDILNINYRYSIRPTGTVITTGTLNPYYPAQFAFDKNTDTYALFTTANGSLGLDYGVGNNQQIINVGVLPQDGKTYNLVFEYSNDNVTWTSVLATGAVTPGAKTWQYWAIDRPIPARYFRVRETNGALIAFDEVVFATVQQDIPLAALNRDDYYNLSNKDGQYGARSLQYWFDKQITPKIWLWPVPSRFVSGLQLFAAPAARRRRKSIKQFKYSEPLVAVR